ncbi:polyphosphate kinase 2 [Sphaerotilus microaerophilus]|uniref:ADP/GDP-polyphosphate phosphotransferase n=1 Tax=Sphaerotilus microaerophilus TaxID=2914710 RepID=A0ABN6PID6_9BURK|nr:polyphosphate kinase 2 [Sphaerotilus sp. FB-5]BDI03385.1 transcriptional regulator [Sphaerotilus sp. FB-5]
MTKKNGSATPDKLGKSDYFEQLGAMQLELNEMARWLAHSRQRLVVVLEGRDTAGKGGVANAIAETLNPRQCRVVALGKPSEREAAQWYFQRYVPHLPAAGEIVIFDRSWYNRAGVERVMGWAGEAQVQAFLRQTPKFEKLLVDDGLLLFKYWLTVDQAQQEERFAERLNDPLKRWKLSEIDLQARQRYAAYGKARDAMLDATHSDQAPWTLVDFNDQRLGRLTLIRHLLDRLPDHPVPEKKLDFPPLEHAPLTEKFTAAPRPIPLLKWRAADHGKD